MTIGFSQRSLDKGCAALMKLTAEIGVSSNEDCKDFTDPKVVKQYLIDITTKEY